MYNFPIEFLIFKLFSRLFVLQLSFLCLCKLSIKKLFVLTAGRSVKPEEIMRDTGCKQQQSTGRTAASSTVKLKCSCKKFFQIFYYYALFTKYNKINIYRNKNINQGYRWNIDLANVIITTKQKIDNKTYFNLASTKEAINETIARNDSHGKIART